MAISFRSVTTATDNGSSATVSVTTSESPQATQSGDLVLVFYDNDFYAIANMGTPTATGSPTINAVTAATADDTAAGSHIKVYWYVANTAGAQTITATETGTHDEDKGLAVYVLAGADTSNPIDGASNTVQSTSSSTSVVTGVTTATSTALLFCHLRTSRSAAGGGSWTPPASMTERYDVANFTTFTGATEQLSASGATGTRTFTPAASAPFVAAAVAIKTAAAAAQVFVSAARRRPPTPVRIRHATTAAPPAQVFVPQARRRRPTPTLVRRGRAAQVVPPQVVVTVPPQPPQLVREKIRWFASRRGRVAQVTPPQVVVPPPPIPPQFLREKTRWFASRRGEAAQVVPPQAVAPPPPIPPQLVREKLRWFATRRGRVAAVVAPQVVVPLAVRSRGRFLPQRRPRVATTPPAQVKPPMVARVRSRLPLVRRGRPAQVVPPQVVVVPPYRPRGVFQKLRQLVFRRSRFVGSGWMVGPVHVCITPRPGIGTTARPGSGTTAYNAATIARPNSGTTARPNTGQTDDPC